MSERGLLLLRCGGWSLGRLLGGGEAAVEFAQVLDEQTVVAALAVCGSQRDYQQNQQQEGDAAEAYDAVERGAAVFGLELGVVEGGEVGELMSDLFGREGVAHGGIAGIVGDGAVMATGAAEQVGAQTQVLHVEPGIVGVGRKQQIGGLQRPVEVAAGGFGHGAGAVVVLVGARRQLRHNHGFGAVQEGDGAGIVAGGLVGGKSQGGDGEMGCRLGPYMLAPVADSTDVAAAGIADNGGVGDGTARDDAPLVDAGVGGEGVETLAEVGREAQSRVELGHGTARLRKLVEHLAADTVAHGHGRAHAFAARFLLHAQCRVVGLLEAVRAKELVDEQVLGREIIVVEIAVAAQVVDDVAQRVGDIGAGGRHVEQVLGVEHRFLTGRVGRGSGRGRCRHRRKEYI